ncbi:uncharacterized protein SPSK_03228 [Sporothrix schenckii 1099-18]|uniref:Major facilitator superfamily (MFS) profile domain-containing protein n=2 Tax=Sporothrix schenckii TaxID=29908 RepID=U7PSD8_SPOS1|nr:uncharacterized protein SPSK_03228 [Sporothrix schenckii 1099-18]ERS97664.1 hypothetical protein HMPREF1624_05835 [Sporothrix schenckii ATCC 58251]KJR82188.1 hypothetical protein SPSK_03228 [Sporothrix schenckii 1099-18]
MVEENDKHVQGQERSVQQEAFDEKTNETTTTERKINSSSQPAGPSTSPRQNAGLEAVQPDHDNDHDNDDTNIVRRSQATKTAAKTEDMEVSGASGTTQTPVQLTSALTHVSSAGPDAPAQPWSSFVEIPDEFYDRLAPRRKMAIVALLSFCSLLAPISSTSVLPAVPDVAAEFHSTGSIVDISNALYLLFMGLSPTVWGPLSEVYGRRPITLATSFLFFCCTLGTALAPNLAAFFVFRVLSAFEGTAFILVGSAAVGDIYRPTERATAMGWFMAGTLVGPAFGPFVGGIIVTYKSWRVILWLQAALAGTAFVGTLALLPETIHHRKIDSLAGYPLRSKLRVLGPMLNPVRVIRLFVYPNLVMAGSASSSLVWNMYALLTPIRYVLNPRFHLTTPMQSGLFYLAPGIGYVCGTFFGGRYADHMVRRWIKKRNGQRVPEDRLRSALPFLGGVIPACILVYGWGVERGVGGIPLAVIMLFLQGVAQLFCFPSINTYCLDVMQSRGSEVIAANYFVRYLFACAGTAVVLPATERIGVGWFSTISALFLVASAVALWTAVVWGQQWRDRVDRWRDGRRKAEHERAQQRLQERTAPTEHP